MIYVNGDSWTSGWPLEGTFGHRNHSWPHLLSELSSIEVFNDARTASSNYRIYRRTFDYILNNSPKIAIICLTSWARFELGDIKSGRIHQYLPHQKEVAFFYKKYWNPYLEYSNLLRRLLSLQCVAQVKSTKLYFLDTFNDNLNMNPSYEWFTDILKMGDIFSKMDDEYIAKKYKKIIDLDKHINYNMFISDKSYQSLVNDCELVEGHPVEDGHIKIAKLIYEVIKKDI